MTAVASFAAIGTTAVVAVTTPGALGEARSLLQDELDRFDRACSRFREDSELSYANAHAGEPVLVGPLLAEAVRVALAAAAATGGLVTPTLGRNLRLSGYDRTFELVRARSGWALSPVPATVHAWQEVQLDDDRLELVVPPGIELDLGATAKALAADRAAERIAASTGAGTLVSLGGDVAVCGAPPPGGFAVRIADDHTAPVTGPGPIVGVLGGGLATSTTTVRRWPTDRGELHHVFDPRTGTAAVTPWRTISVAAPSCVDANVAATAALVLGLGATAWLAARHLSARLVHSSGRAVHVGDWPDELEAA
jgi:FAD:protein FMN transferase